MWDLLQADVCAVISNCCSSGAKGVAWCTMNQGMGVMLIDS